MEVRLHIERLDRVDIPHRDRVTILRGQLSNILRMVDQDIPVPISLIVNAERVARSLETAEVEVNP
jgi:hypothetical protein